MEVGKKLLAFRELEYPHIGSVIYAAIISVLREYEVTDKLFRISFDNASANITAIDIFLQNILLSCLHVVQIFFM